MSVLDDKVIQGGVINLDDLLKLLDIMVKRGEWSCYYHVTISFNRLTCANCGQEIGIYFSHTNQTGKETHAIFKPCTRVVLGTDHRISGKIINTKLYFCFNCIENIPEALAEQVPEPEIKDQIKSRLQENSIINMPNFIVGKGCWATVTEFPMGYKGRDSGRFLNYQTSIENYKILLRDSFLRAYLTVF